MFSKKMLVIYRRLLIFGLLLMCLFVFGYSDKIESVSAARPCVQECEANQGMCNDDCAVNCSATDGSCNSCITSCRTQYWNCMAVAIYCETGPVNNSRCSVGYADHCPIIGGQTKCDDPSAHSGYFEICNTSVGNMQCVSCPDHEFCQGSNGLPPCF